MREEVGCALEPSKEVVIPRMMGSGAHAQTAISMQEGQITQGKKQRCARYLGAWPEANGGCQSDITKHIAAMRTGYFAFYRVWKDQ